jgi:hypothetical protein
VDDELLTLTLALTLLLSRVMLSRVIEADADADPTIGGRVAPGFRSWPALFNKSAGLGGRDEVRNAGVVERR